MNCIIIDDVEISVAVPNKQLTSLGVIRQRRDVCSRETRQDVIRTEALIVLVENKNAICRGTVDFIITAGNVLNGVIRKMNPPLAYGDAGLSRA